MKKYIYILIALLGFVACNNEVDTLPDDCNPIALRGIRAVIDNGSSTRAVAPLVDSIGKYAFGNKDEIIFTKIQRTKHPIEGFSYKDVRYSGSADGESWTREDPEDDIFWSDGSEPHTFIGYILPHDDDKNAKTSGYDWNKQEGGTTYYGSIGDPTLTEDNDIIDYTAIPATGAGGNEAYDLEKLRKEDLLLTYNTEMQNEDAFATVHFHHALASVRVVVTISGFSSTGKDPDAETKVTDLQLYEQPTMYKWNGLSYKADPLVENDQTALNSFDWKGGDIPSWDQKKDMKLWQSREYRGSGANRTFTFYGIVAPGEQEQVKMDFNVSYPDPLDPNQTQRLEKKYAAILKLANGKSVEFRPGFCTSINVNLNHKDEKMTVGAEYMSWQFEDTPDEGSLKKNSTYLEKAPAFKTGMDQNIVTIIGDTKTKNPDDATWLYVAGKDGNGKDIIKDIYGHTGTDNDPYTICTADQLLSFAYEVKNGRDFMHQYIKLDADITMQKNKDSNSLDWIGIGDASHPFNGFFLGSNRYINRLKGQHFFHTIGDNAVIDKLNFENVLEVNACGVVAHENKGLICACYIYGDVNESEIIDYTGSIVGINQSFIIACAHVGKVIGKSKIIGGLVGFNNGTVMACYHSGEVKAADGVTGADVHATVGKRGDGTGDTNNSIMFSCYYDESMITHTPTLVPSKSGFPLSATMMQSNTFVNGEKDFRYYGQGGYMGQGETLHDVLLFLAYGDEQKDEHTSETVEQLMNSLVAQGLTERVNDVFGYHFSLNEALNAFRLWLNAIAAEAETKGDDYKVQTNCHEFTKLQILFLKQHYTTKHRFVYTPAAYPKVQ